MTRDSLTHDRRSQELQLASLRAEARTRRALTGTAWWIEQTQREAVPIVAPSTPADAKAAWENASTLQRGLWIENRLRTLDADRTINQRPAGTPAWAVPGRGTHDTLRSTSWDKPLAQMAEQVARAMVQRGAAIALNPPAWATSYLGHVLHAAASDLRKDNGFGSTRVPPTGATTEARRPTPALVAANDVASHPRPTTMLEATQPQTAPAPQRRAPARQQPPAQRVKPLRALIERINAPALRQHLQVRAQIIDNIAIANRNLEALKTLPLGRDEALIDRLHGRIRLQNDIATQQDRLETHDRQGPRRPSIVRRISEAQRSAANERPRQPSAAPRRSPQQRAGRGR